MKNLLLITLLIIGLNGFSQNYNDIIVSASDTINCKITFVNDQNIFFDYLKKKSNASGNISISDVSFYIKDGKQTDLSAQYDSLNYVGDKYVYCELVGTQKFLSTKIIVSVDYGEYGTTLKSKFGKHKLFNSMIDGLNYMGSKGWEFVQAYTITLNNSSIYHYVLKKTIKENPTN